MPKELVFFNKTHEVWVGRCASFPSAFLKNAVPDVFLDLVYLKGLELGSFLNLVICKEALEKSLQTLLVSRSSRGAS